jgi:phage gpG-like protein
MSVILTGVRELVEGIARMAERQHAAAGSGLGRAAHLLERAIKSDLSVTSSTGAEQRDSKGRFAARGSTSSPPGDPPFLRSGDLRRSVQTDGPTVVSGTQWEASVGPTMVYGRIQELGGTAGNGAELPARPYVAPALDATMPAMREIMKSAWRAGQAL